MTYEPKFCKDCKHFREGGAVAIFGSGFGWPESCTQPPERDLIHGRKTPADPGCMRSERGACKPEALLWEEKPSEPAPEVVPSPITGMPLRVQPELPPLGTWIDTPVATLRWWEFWK